MSGEWRVVEGEHGVGGGGEGEEERGRRGGGEGEEGRCGRGGVGGDVMGGRVIDTQGMGEERGG